ncbi:D-ribose pyranase [Clostridium sp. D2Q-11]|uniref:D-ribose pyranase n=1 Tax=Anaeromonas frigoriresistens TaxID=2683708 RepID=A0A942UYV6_9FIRM|nr:D-ribose pyranase [Anaeromonas frigoriresistens]MBS4538846.1 D-ribose pyranase [Anaeromonas frigoriresistens]
MKKTKLINSNISYMISKMGHKDTLTIADSGLPIPNDVDRIDLALQKGIPSFMDCFKSVMSELKVEEVIIASEMEKISPELYEELMKEIENIKDEENCDIKITRVNHEEFKEITKDTKAVIRSGEFTPFANIILKSGVVF